MKPWFLIFSFVWVAVASSLGQEREPSEFRVFSDKGGKSIEARILSVSDDLSRIRMEGKDAATFDTAINGLSLDDQQFIRDWLYPGDPDVKKGTIRIFGNLPNAAPIHVEALAGERRIRSVHAAKAGWFVHLENDEVKTFEDKFSGLTGIRQLAINTVWMGLTRHDGKAQMATGDLHHEGDLTDVVEIGSGGGNHLARLTDGSVRVWGRGYDPKGLQDSPVASVEAIRVAATQGEAAIVDAEGAVHVWSPKTRDVRSQRVGDGVEAIDSGIFHFVVLTRSGEVYEWSGVNLDRARIPAPLADEEGPFRQIRCNGVTRAAQRDDGTWIAWGMNGAGIVDHINQLGPTEDLDFFSEPSKQDHGYVIWIEPES